MTERDSTKPVPAEDEDIIRRAQELAAQLLVGPNCCPICSFPLAASPDQGCVIGNCSFRPFDEHEKGQERSQRAQFDAYVAVIIPAMQSLRRFASSVVELRKVVKENFQLISDAEDVWSALGMGDYEGEESADYFIRKITSHAEVSREIENAVAELKAARTAWHEDFGVPISESYARFLEAIGKLTDLVEAAQGERGSR